MKRSEINRRLRDAEIFFETMKFQLPPFASWSPAEWEARREHTAEITACRLGWDLTDFGSGDFDRVGLLLFTLRNGRLSGEPETKTPETKTPETKTPETKTYAEKIMIVAEDQVTPWHFHWTKFEDIINRGGGALVVQLAWASDNEASLKDGDVVVSCDGVARTVRSQSTVTLEPGESITLPPKMYHQFWGAGGRGNVLVGEVSKTNDDEKDNRFLQPVGRFPKIEEDETPYRLLCSEYGR